MRHVRSVAIVCALAAVCLAAPDNAVSVRAKMAGGHGSPNAEFHIDADGSGRVDTAVRWTQEVIPLSFDFRITEAELADLRRGITESAFFDDWGAERPPVCDAEVWDVSISLGAKQKRRTRMSGEARFRPVEEFLWRLLAQAQAVDSIRRGGAVTVAHTLEYPAERARLFRPDELIPELAPALALAAVAAEKPHDAGEAAMCLVRLASAEDFARLSDEVLAKVEGERRDAVLSSFAHELRSAERATQRAAFAPVAVAEIRNSWKGWKDFEHRRTDTLRVLHAIALRERNPDALALAEEMMRTLSTLDVAFFAGGVVDLGTDAVPIALRLLADAAPQARYAGTSLARELIVVAKPAKPRQVTLTDGERAALLERLGTEVMDVVVAHSRDPAEAVPVREECFRTIALWEGRDLAAERRKEQADAAARRKAESDARDQAAAEERRKGAAAQGPPVPRGELSISGRLVGDGGVGLAGFCVGAESRDGPDGTWRLHGASPTEEDGSFRIEHLVAGEFRLNAVRGREWRWRLAVHLSSAKDGVRAGATDVVLGFVGSMIRGRLLDAAGRPLQGQYLKARMRDAPSGGPSGQVSTSGDAETDREGRFVMLELVPGVYDLASERHPFLDGTSGVRTGPDEITVCLVDGGAISGRVVDELGAPLAGAAVAARVQGRIGVGLGTRTGADGAFRIAGLDSSLRYIVSAGFAAPTCDLAADSESQGVRAGAVGIEFRIDTGPRLDVRVDFGRRGIDHGPRVRLVRDGDPAGTAREFVEGSVVWRAAPEGTWHVFARVRDLDENGAPVQRWIEVGTARTGDPARSFEVPK